MFAVYLFLRFQNGREIRQTNPSQTLMNLQFYKWIRKYRGVTNGVAKLESEVSRLKFYIGMPPYNI